MPARGLYLVTPTRDDDARLLAECEAGLAGGAVLLQYRDKQAGPATRRRRAEALLALCRRHGVPLVVNDDLALAAAIGAEGVHLGRDDGPAGAARAKLGPGAIVGVSCYDQPGRARDASDAGADYVAFGSFFPSPTKPGAVRAPTSLLALDTGCPKVAIGGIDADNAAALVAAGADLVAVISGVFDAPDPAAAARRIASLFDARNAP